MPSGLFGLMATTSRPFDLNSFASGMSRVSAACEYGQWFERNTTISSFAAL